MVKWSGSACDFEHVLQVDAASDVSLRGSMLDEYIHGRLRMFEPIQNAIANRVHQCGGFDPFIDAGRKQHALWYRALTSACPPYSL